MEMLAWRAENEDDDEQKGNSSQFKAKAALWYGLVREGRAL